MPFNTHRTHLNAGSKTIYMELEIKRFKTAAEILAEIWSESIIDGHPFKGGYIDPQERRLKQPNQKDGREFMNSNRST